jgi:hypothetical protein
MITSSLNAVLNYLFMYTFDIGLYDAPIATKISYSWGHENRALFYPVEEPHAQAGPVDGPTYTFRRPGAKRTAGESHAIPARAIGGSGSGEPN